MSHYESLYKLCKSLANTRISDPFQCGLNIQLELG